MLKGLVAEFPGERKYRFDLFHGYQALGLVVLGKNRASETEELYRSAVVLIKELSRDYPDEPNYRDALASVTIYLGTLLRARGDCQEAERLLRESLQTAELLHQTYPDRRTPPHFLANAARSLVALGTLQWSMGRTGEAEGSFRRALAVWEQLVGDHPTASEEPAYRQYAMECRFNLGNLYLDQGKLSEAQGCFDQCLPMAERLAREYPRVPEHRVFSAQVHVQRAICLLAAGQQGAAEAAFGRFVTRMEESIIHLQSRHDLKWLLVEQLGMFPVPRLRHPDRAVELAERTAALAPNPRGLGIAYYRAGRWRESIRELQKEGQELRRDTLVVRLFLAMAHWNYGDKERARQLYDPTAAWMDSHQVRSCLERCLRAEAAELLGVKKPR